MDNFPEETRRRLVDGMLDEYNEAVLSLGEMRRHFDLAHLGGTRGAVRTEMSAHFTGLENTLNSYRRNLESYLTRRLLNAIDDDQVPAYLAAPANPNDEFFRVDLNEITERGAEVQELRQHSLLMNDVRRRLLDLLHFIFEDLKKLFGNGARLEEKLVYYVDTANNILERVKTMADIIRPEFQV